MQMKNNYQIKWEIRGYNGYCVEEGSGVFNGDCGIIQEIDAYNKQVTVLFDEEKYVTYSQGELDELELAYAITIHKSQGSEYPAGGIASSGGTKAPHEPEHPVYGCDPWQKMCHHCRKP